MMAPSPRGGAQPAAPRIRAKQGLPWLTIIAVVVVIAIAGAITWVVVGKARSNAAAQNRQDELTAVWGPTVDNRDPSEKINGIYIGAVADKGPNTPLDYLQYRAAIHVTPEQRVQYDRFPPVGGPHDGQWADCRGVVYNKAVRDENMVHTLEHGAIWIAYNPDQIKGAALDKLKGLVQGQSFISMSPYPGLKSPISLQAWGHQLTVPSADDPRIEQFITALRQNQYVYPETGATCDPGPAWDSANPPAFNPAPRTATDVPMDGSGAAGAATDNGMGNTAGGPAVSGQSQPVPSGAAPSQASTSG